ncbi:uncharacterized protein MONOS_17615 [Monocercomonoides exilis]|uniref:uncharacterized protein n=2 Tax=Monocercomonoides exilis TaxID=2049356 RepID=UPI003559495A|nr:hypothetical protein MONOS_17615 [Monocercomonoides exilis]
MSVHLFLFACLYIAEKIEGKQAAQIASLENQGTSADSRFQYFQACLNGNRIEDEHFLAKNTEANELKLNLYLWGIRWQSGASSSINTFFGFFNSSVGLKNVALEYSSSPFVLITGKSSIMMDSCISRQKSASPFHLQSGSICLTNMTLIPQKNLNPSSLVFSSDGPNSAILRNCIMADLAVSSSDYFLVSGKSKNEQINDCAFRNISVKSFKSSDYLMEHSCFRSSMENCLIYSCVNIFEGGISSGAFSSQEFVCKNISSHFGKREANELERKQRIDTTESQSFSLCEWSDCAAPQGGALYVHENANAILTVENSSFTRCNASSTNGGGIYALKIAECVVLHSSFVECNAAAISSCGSGGIICYSTRQTSNRVSTDYDSIADKSEWLRNDFGRTRYVSSAQTEPNAKDTYACGLDESHACSTISRCLTQLIPGIVTDVEIFSGTTIETNRFDCGVNTYAIYGQSDMSTTMQTELDAAGLSLFSVSTGTLTARDFVLVHDSSHPNNRGSRLFEISGAGEISIRRLNISFGSEQSTETAFSIELINVQSGMFQMGHVNWAKMISRNSLFSLSSTNEISLTLLVCSFDGIERTTSGAAVMSFSNDKANIDLNLCTFEGCGSTTSADGGSMMLCAGNENEVKVKDGAFDGCYCSASYGLGGGILLRLLNENPDFLISSSFGTNTAKWGRDIFVLSPNLEETATSRKIACVTSSSDSVDKVRGYDNGNTSVAIPLCIYLLPTPEEIYVSNTEASDHSHCGIVQFPYPSSELTFLFLSVESGILIIDKFSASSIALSGSPLISLSGSSTEAEFMNTPWLNMTNSNFTEIERAAGSGGCVSFDNGHDENSNAEINIEECDFDGCSVMADESRGGALNAQLKGNTQLNIVSCTFTGCAAPAGEEKTGFGGGLALKLIDDDSSFVISSPVFDADKPNVAKYGNDVFVESSNLTKSLTNTSLPFVTENLSDISLNSLRGFDGNDTTNAIPLIYFWLSLGSEIFIGSEGRDMHACGFSDYPCLSIDYSLMRLSEGNERNVSIIGKGYLRKSVDVSGASIKSKDSSSICSLECNSSLEGAEGMAMKIQGITNFELISFVVPLSFTSGVNVLLHIGSSEGLLTLKDCSFTKKGDDREEVTHYGLIKAEGGTVVLELVTMQSLCFSKDVISVQPTTILRIKNLTMKNVELDGASGLSITKSSRRENNEIEQDVVIEWSLFEEVTQNTTDDIPIIRHDNDEEPLKMVIRNTTMKKCGGTRCGKGGGMFCMLNEGGSFDCLFCTISECFCSTTGRGGWLFLECTSTAEQPLNFVLSNITFVDNSALRGRDVYIRCHSIDAQIVEGQFLLDFRAPFAKELAMWGCTTDSFVDEEDLLLRVMRYQSETIFVSSVANNHGDSKRCGEFSAPCRSLNAGVQHIIPSSYSQLLISEESVINRGCDARDVIIRSLKSPSVAFVYLNSTIGDEGSLIRTSGNVRIERLKFSVGQLFSYSGSSIIHEANGQLSLSFVDFSSIGESNGIEAVVLNSSLLSIESGILHIDNCSVSLLSFKKPSFLLSGDEISLTNVKLEQIESMANVFELGQCGGVVFNGACADGVKLSEGCIIGINSSTSGAISIGSASFKNCSRNSEGASVLSASSSSAEIVLSNCSCESCNSLSDKGGIIDVNELRNVSMNLCQFSGMVAKESESGNDNAFEEICEWNGSLVHSENSDLQMVEIKIENSSKGGISIKGGKTVIEMGMLANNNPFVEKYPSLRQNIICSDSASLTISSLKGGDGLKDNSSLWILNDGCTLGGIAGERSSPLFIPRLEEVSVNESGSNIELKFKGSLLLPCDLSFRLEYNTGDVELVETYEFEESSFVSETEVIGTIPSDKITTVADETEVSVVILFGKQLAETSPQILKNKTEPKTGNDKMVEGGKEGKSYWLLIVIVLVVMFLIVLIVSIVLAIRWRKAKNENKDLREIVNDNIRKDPKAFEMVTMETSPEEQWRRAEREAEKKNEERIKKRVYEKSLGHSESSEHLLSECGSTEYILGKDSYKIPEWALEKVEEEETRKRTPSPSVSSTSTTDTSDTESTFVRSESLCLTTSSMSNLVDAMACSCPHEKLIVDLRDSLFMLLHGRNEKKEMAIGSLKEREQTAAQVLFWVANGALHSFEDEEDDLPSLASLSPHIVLFSEHMVICIVMHSDFLSSEDSDSSSDSSSTVVTSASDESDSLPSSAFEEEDEFKKECLRWKAPELQMNKKMRATKESVAFSIGMMLWGCLTVEIPFGEYAAEVAGQKIANHERPDICGVEESEFFEIIRACLSGQPEDRLELTGLKREFIERFPGGAVMVTISDAIDQEETTEMSDEGTSVDGLTVA